MRRTTATRMSRFQWLGGPALALALVAAACAGDTGGASSGDSSNGDSASPDGGTTEPDTAGGGDVTGGGDDAGRPGTDADAVVENLAPTATITSPADGALLAHDAPIALQGEISDDGDGASALTARWSSDIGGELGTSPVDDGGLTSLEATDLLGGTHVITLAVTDSGGLDASDSVTVVVNTPPGAPAVQITPESPLTTDDLTAAIVADTEDPDRAPDTLQYRWRWLVEGAEVEGLTSPSVDAAETARGQVWVVGVRAFDGLTEGPEGTAQVLIGNTAPSCTAATLAPGGPTTTQPLTCTCDERADVDDTEEQADPVEDHCTFLDAGGEELAAVDAVDGSCELDAELTGRGLQITCLFVPSDGLHEGEAVETTAVTVINSAPGAAGVTLDPGAGTVLTTFTCDITTESADPDDDELSYDITWRVNGFANDATLPSTLAAAELVSDVDGTAARGGDAVTCEVIADDGFTTSTPVTSNEVVLDNASPLGGTVQIEPPTAVEGTVLTCATDGATDPDGDGVSWTYVWWVGDTEVVEQTESTLDSDWFSAGQTVSCTATPTDGSDAGTPVPSSNVVLVENTAPGGPVISLSPAAGSVDTTFTCNIDEPGPDPDDDELTYTITWVVNGHANSTGLGSDTVLAADLSSNQDGAQAKGGDEIQCQVIASDGSSTSPAVLSDGVVLSNTPPLGGSVSLVPGTASETTLLTCDAGGALDPDGDEIIWTYSWTVGGVSVTDDEGGQVGGSQLDGTYFDKHQVVSCTATPGDGVALGDAVPSANSVTIDNSSPGPPGVTLQPEAGSVETELTCAITTDSPDADDDELVYSYEWLVNGYPNADSNSATMTPTDLVSDADGSQATGGDEISCRAVATDDDGSQSLPGPSGGVVLDNTAPSGGFVTIQPPDPTETSTLSCLAGGAVDPDGDNVTWSYAWFVDDEELVEATGATLKGADFDKGDTVSCVATPTDGPAEGPAVAADAPVTILNTPPSPPVPFIAPDAGVVGTEFSCETLVPSEDVDTGPETLTYEYTWFVDGYDAPQATGQTVTPAGALVSDALGAPVRRGDGIRCEAVGLDDEDAASAAGASAVVVLDNSAPEGGAVVVDPPTAAEGETLSCLADAAVDPDGDDVAWDYEWFINGELLDGADELELGSDAFGAGQTITCTATPRDDLLAGAPVPSSNSVLVDNTLPNPPAVSLSPDAGQVLTTFTCQIDVESVDPDGDEVSYAYSWLVGEYQDAGIAADVDSVVPKDLKSDAEGTPARGGDSIRCEVVATDGLGFSEATLADAVLLGNTAPIGGVVEIDPPEAAEGTTLTCVADNASDPDFGDVVTWLYAWSVNEETLEGSDEATLDSALFGSNDVVACTATPTDGEHDGIPVPSANQVLVGNSVPGPPVAGIDPDQGTVETEFTCTVTEESVDPDGEEVTYKYAWFVGEHLNQGIETATVTPTALVSDIDGTPARGGDSVKCRLRGFDGFGLSEPSFSLPVLLDGSPPREGVVVVEPGTVVEGEELACVPSDVFDPDGDDITYTYAWYIDDELVADQTGNTLSSEHFDKDEVVRCTALPSDGELDGELLEDLVGATVLNTLPSLESAALEPAEATRAESFTCSFEGWTDPDPADDADQVTYRWLLAGDPEPTAIDGEVAAVLAATHLSPGDEVLCEVTPFDSDGAGVPRTSGLGAVVNIAPTLEATLLTPTEVFADSVLDCTPSDFADGDGDEPIYEYAWLLNGQPVDGEDGASLSGVFVKGDEVRCVVTASDGFDSSDGVPSETVTVSNTLPSLTGVAIAPALATVCEAFTCSHETADDIDVADQGDLAVTYSWTVNGTLVDGADTDTLVIPEVAPDDVAVCTVSVWDGTVDDNLTPITTSAASGDGVVFNTAPTLEAVELGPVDPVRGTVVTCAPSGFADEECDPPEGYAYGWTYVYLGEEFPTDNETDQFDTSELPPGTLLSCGVVAYDGYDHSEAINADPVFVQNGPPSAPVTGISAPDGADGALTCLLLTPAEDFEPISYTYYWRIGDGAEFVGAETLAANQVDHCDLVACRAVATDGLADAGSEWTETVLPYGTFCDDTNPCTDDSCADGGGCAHVDNASDCDDGEPCSHADKCGAGTCEGQDYECVDGSDCTDNVCLGDGQCDFPHNTAPCDDLNPCSVNDTCAAGQCSGAPKDCSGSADQCNTAACDGGDCVLTPIPDIECTDDDVCTYDDLCAADGSCVGTWDIFGCGCIDDTGCTDETDECHIGKCNVEFNTCFAEVQLGLGCDDGDACSHTDQCNAEGTCEGTTYVCDDDNVCTDDSCLGDDTCSHVANTLGCDDDDACTTADQCADKACVGGPALPCDDGLFCTGVESCDSATGCVDGTPPVTNDGVDCTVDSCDEDNNVVVHDLDHQFCATGQLCITDTCDLVEGCVESVTPDCCGNGLIEGDEECDDGNDAPGDGCTPACACQCDLVASRVCTQPFAGLPTGDPATGVLVHDVTGVSTSIASGDVDGDGHSDLVVGYRGSENYLLLSNGSATPFEGVTPTKITGDEHQTQAVALYDINRDGHLDLVAGNDGEPNRLYLNNGSGAPFDQVTGQDITSDADNTYSLAIGDLDMNGTPDVVAGNLFGTQKLYSNNGTLPAPFAGVSGFAIGPEADATRALLLGDYDRDGDLDLIAGNDGSPDLFYPNLGAPFFFFGSFGVDMGGGDDATFALVQGDLDGDGDVDILGGVNGGDDVLYFNTGPPQFFFFPQDIPGVPNATRALVLADSDQDGDDDLLEVNDSQPFHLFYNLGPPFPFVGQASGSGSTEAPVGRAMAAADFDGDGDSDLVTLDAAGQALYYPGLEYVDFEGTVSPVIPNDSFTTLSLAAADIDSDGAPDLLAGGTGLLPLAYHRSNGSAAPWLDTNPRPVAFDLPRVDGVATADFDHDGHLDVAAVSLAGSPRYIAGNGTADGLGTATPVAIGGPGESARSIAIGDLDRDGNPDVVAGGADGVLRIYFSNGSGSPFAGVSALSVLTTVGAAVRVQLADFDRDGDLDIALATLGTDAVVVNDGSATPFVTLDEVLLTTVDADTHDMAVGDIDGNGTVDIITASDAGLIRYLTPPDALAGPTDATALPVGAVTAVALTDLNGDASLDLVLGRSGVDEVMLSDTGSDPFVGAAATAVALAADALTHALLPGDFDRDGAADVAAGQELLVDAFHTNDALLDLLLTGQCQVLCTTQPLDCDDALFCTGVEVCDDDNHCLPGTPPTIDDEFDCTVAQCDEDTDSIVQVPDHTVCGIGTGCDLYLCDPSEGGCIYTETTDCCGNSVLETGEQCDDANGDEGDGCRPDCTCECEVTGPWLCAPGEPSAPFDQAIDSDITDELLAAKGGALGDVNGDGALDLVIAVDGAPNRIYLSNGTTAPFDQVAGGDLTGDVQPSTAVALADMDSDGDLDAVVANLAGRTRLYLNNGTSDPFDLVVGTDITDDEHSSTFVTVADVNGDGNLDVLVANSGAPSRLYLSAGGPTPFAGVTGLNIGQESGSAVAIAVGDLDGDNLPDVVIGVANSFIRAYTNSAEPESPFDAPNGIALGVEFTTAADLALADVDGDGRLDIVVGNDEGIDRLYLNDYDWAGTPEAKAGDPIGSTPDATRGVVATDMNRDGHADVVIGAFGGRTRLTRNNGSAAPFDAVVVDDITSDNGPTVDVLVGDMDRDGDLDVIAVNAAAPSKLYLSRAAPEEEVVIDPAIGGSSGDSWAAAAADLNGDGSVDLLVGRRDQPNDLYANNGNISPFAGVLGAPLDTNTDDTRGLAVGDVDHDGDLDVVAGNFAQRTRLHLNNGSSDPFGGVTASDITGDQHSTWDVHLADLTGDGHLDAITINAGEVTRVYPGDGTATPFANTVGISLGSDAQQSRAGAVGDVDGDGDLDLVVANAGAPNRLYLIDQAAEEPIATATGSNITGESHQTMAIALVDLNADGHLDVIAGNTGGRDRVYYNNGTSDPFAGVAGVDLSLDSLATRALAVVDVDGDGTLDVVTGNDGAAARLVLSPAAGSPAAATDIAGSSGPTRALAMGMLNFDGGADLFIARSEAVDLLLLNGVLVGADLPDGCGGYCPPTPLDCDDGNSCTFDTCNTLSGCDHSTSSPNCCGNGVEEFGEACDDGNQVDGDGCSSSCVVEGPGGP